MKYTDPELQDRLAAEYALGTLRGAARRRFEGLMAAHPSIRRRVRQWNDHLQGTLAPPPLAPPPAVWQALERRLFPAETAPAEPWYRRLNLWRALTAVTAVLALVMTLGLVQEQRQRTGWAVVLSSMATNAPTWLVSAPDNMGVLTVKNMRPMTLPERMACVLWVVPENGGQPRMVGVLPDDGQRVIEVSTETMPMINGRLLVTVEDISDGMPKTPANRPMYSGEWIRLQQT